DALVRVAKLRAGVDLHRAALEGYDRFPPKAADVGHLDDDARGVESGHVLRFGDPIAGRNLERRGQRVDRVEHLGLVDPAVALLDTGHGTNAERLGHERLLARFQTHAPRDAVGHGIFDLLWNPVPIM